MKIKHEQLMMEAQDEIKEKTVEIEILKEMIKGV
jgi:hypothetical protein